MFDIPVVDRVRGFSSHTVATKQCSAATVCTCGYCGVGVAVATNTRTEYQSEKNMAQIDIVVVIYSNT